MTYIKINNELYPTISIDGRMIDGEWDGRSFKAITLEMTGEQARELFVDDVEWSIVMETDKPITRYEQDEEGRPVPVTKYETIGTKEATCVMVNNSNYSVAGDIVVHRNGTVTVKMGAVTRDDVLNLLLEGLDL